MNIRDDFSIKIGKGILKWEGARHHWIPGITWWPGLDIKGNTLDTKRIIGFPRWFFKKIF